MARALVFGAAVFIASYTVAELVARGHETTVYDLCRRSPVTTEELWRLQRDRISAVAEMTRLERGDIRDIDAVRRTVGAAAPQLVLFLPSLLAGESATDPLEALSIHVQGLQNVLDA